MSVYQRVDVFLKSKKIYKKDAAIGVDVSRETVFNWFRKPKTMPVYFLIWIKEKFPELNLEWLLTGEGEMELIKDKKEVDVEALYKKLEEVHQHVRVLMEEKLDR